MNMADSQSKEPVIDRVIERLEELSIGERAVLRRSNGNLKDASSDVIGLFYGRVLYERLSAEDEARYFLIAVLYAWAKNSTEDDIGLGASLKTIRDGQSRKSDGSTPLDRRVLWLLRSDGYQFQYRLREMIRLLKAHRTPINYRKLYFDVRDWGDPDLRDGIRRAWLRVYYE
jgi:CRISPR type I-E-associated protein CasB/Cse2